MKVVSGRSEDVGLEGLTVARQILWREWLVNRHAASNLFTIWILVTVVLPVFERTTPVLLTCAVLAQFFAVRLGGADVAWGGESFSLALPARRGQIYWCRFLIGAAIISVFTLTGHVAILYQVGPRLWGAFVESGLADLYGHWQHDVFDQPLVALAMVLGSYSVTFALSASMCGRSIFVGAWLMGAAIWWLGIYAVILVLSWRPPGDEVHWLLLMEGASLSPRIGLCAGITSVSVGVLALAAGWLGFQSKEADSPLVPQRVVRFLGSSLLLALVIAMTVGGEVFTVLQRGFGRSAGRAPSGMGLHLQSGCTSSIDTNMQELFPIFMRLCLLLMGVAVAVLLLRAIFFRPYTDDGAPVWLRFVAAMVAGGIGLAIVWQHDRVMRSGYRLQEFVNAPSFSVPDSLPSPDELNALHPSRRRYIVHAYASPFGDTSRVLSKVERIVTFRELRHLELESEHFHLTLQMEVPDALDDFELKKVRTAFRYPMSGGGFAEIVGPVTSAGERRALVPTFSREPLLAEGSAARWLGWGRSMSGTLQPCWLVLVMIPMIEGGRLKEVGIDGLFALDEQEMTRRWRGPEREDGGESEHFDFAGVRPALGLQQLQGDRSTAQLANHHYGVLVLLCFGAAGLGAFALPVARPLGMVIATVALLALLAALDKRAVDFALTRFQDSSQPLEIRAQALHKGVGTFFWQKSVTGAMLRVARDDRDSPEFRRFVEHSLGKKSPYGRR